MTMEVIGQGAAGHRTPQMHYCRDISDALYLEIGRNTSTDYAYANVYSGGSNTADGTVTIADDTDVYIAGVFESKDSWSIFTNGTDKQTDTNSDVSFPAYDNRSMTISGRNDASNDYFEGKVSEARMSSVARSDAWIAVTNDALMDDDLLQWAEDREEVSEVGWLRGFTYRHKITIPSTNIDSGLINFPVALHLSTSCGTGTDDMSAVFDEIGANSRKLGVTLEDGRTQLPIEVDLWDDTNERAVLHVRVPSLSSSDSNYLYLYYSADMPDNNEYVGGIGDAVTFLVWADYDAVYHLSDDPSGTAPQAMDSTKHENHGTAAGTMLTGDYVDGKAGKAWDLDGTDDEFTAPDSDSWDVLTTEDLTVEAVVNSDTASVMDTIVDSRQTSQPGFVLGFHSDNTVHFFVTDTVDSAEPTGNTTLTRDGTTWYYVGGRFDRTNEEADVWLNAADDVTSATSATNIGSLTNTGSMYFGSNAITSSWTNWSGEFDEIRISKKYREDAWMKATYHTLFDTLLSYNTNAETEDNWLGDWAYRVQCRIDSSLIGSDLTDFPVTLFINSGSGIGARDLTPVFDEVGANSTRIAVATADGTQCYVEIERWDDTSEVAVLHVKIPSVKSGRDTIFYLYYDATKSANTSYVGVIGSTPGQAVWSSDYDWVIHMYDDTTMVNSVDNTSITLNGTLTEVNGPVTGSRGLQANADGDNLGGHTMDFGNDNTVEAQFYIDTGGENPGYDNVFGRNNYIALQVDHTSGNNWSIFYGSGSSWDTAVNANSNLSESTWYTLGGAKDSATISYTRDGADDGGGAITDRNPPSALMAVFDRNDATAAYRFHGIITEFRACLTVAKTDDWMKATQESLIDDLVYFGAQEEEGKDWSGFTGWNQRRPFTIPATNVDATVTDVIISTFLGASVGTGSDDLTPVFDEVGANYKRVAIGAANGTPLLSEMELWDDTGEEGILHTRVRHIDTDYGAKLYLYYNDDQPDKELTDAVQTGMAPRVWKDYGAVYHMNQDPAGDVAGAIKDSATHTVTSNGTPEGGGTMSSDDLVEDHPSGIGYCIDFDTNDYINGTNSADVNLSGDITIMGWGKIDTGGANNHALVTKYDSSNDTGWNLYMQNDGDANFSGRAKGGSSYGATTNGTNTYDDNAWHMFAGRRDGSNWKIFVDAGGANDTASATGGTGDIDGDNQQVRIGCVYVGSLLNFWGNDGSGKIAEVRISDNLFSDAYLKISYYTMEDNLGDWGAVEYEPVGGEIEVVFTTPPTVEFSPKTVTAELSIEMFLNFPTVEFEVHALTTSYIGNIIKLIKAEGSRPRIAVASMGRPGIARAVGKKPRASAAEAFAYQLDENLEN
jgi:hypothetical protein